MALVGVSKVCIRALVSIGYGPNVNNTYLGSDMLYFTYSPEEHA